MIFCFSDLSPWDDISKNIFSARIGVFCLFGSSKYSNLWGIFAHMW
jgi:hypothetical protein